MTNQILPLSTFTYLCEGLMPKPYVRLCQAIIPSCNNGLFMEIGGVMRNLVALRSPFFSLLGFFTRSIFYQLVWKSIWNFSKSHGGFEFIDMIIREMGPFKMHILFWSPSKIFWLSIFEKIYWQLPCNLESFLRKTPHFTIVTQST